MSSQIPFVPPFTTSGTCLHYPLNYWFDVLIQFKALLHGVLAMTLNDVIVTTYSGVKFDQPLITKLNSLSWSTVMKLIPSYCAKIVLGLRTVPPTPCVPVATTSVLI